MSYKHKCLSCDCFIANPDDEEIVPGTHDPVRYRHTTYEGCSKALATPPRGPVNQRHRKHATLEQIERRPDTPWERKR